MERTTRKFKRKRKSKLEKYLETVAVFILISAGTAVTLGTFLIMLKPFIWFLGIMK